MKSDVSNQNQAVGVYFSGTSTTAKKSKSAFPVLDSPNVTVFDGVGTKEHSEKVEYHWITQPLDAIKTAITGYDGHDHKTQNDNTKKYFRESLIGVEKNKSKNMLWAGHSRGAAGGVTGALYEMLKVSELKDDDPNKEELMRMIRITKKIQLLFLDPVSGPWENDLLGMHKDKNLKDPSNKLQDILAKIEHNVNRSDLFEVTYVLARYDSRDQFEICPIHQQFMENSTIPYTVHHIGFQHSAILENFKNSAIYPDPKFTPNTYVKALIEEKLERTPEIPSAEIGKQVQERELHLLDLIKNGEANDKIKWKNRVVNLFKKTQKQKNELSVEDREAIDELLVETGRKGYGVSGQVATHSQFLAVLEHSKDNPNSHAIKVLGRQIDGRNSKPSSKVFIPEMNGEILGRMVEYGVLDQRGSVRYSMVTPQVEGVTNKKAKTISSKLHDIGSKAKRKLLRR